MLNSIINYSLTNKFLVLLGTLGLIGFGTYALMNIPIGAVPDITTNQVQVITTSRDLPTEEVERYLTYPVELEMGNLPGVQEIRSISKFGLSVVTIVFDDDMGSYLPRQLIAEKLKTIEDAIPEGFGSPSMGPISTGLGEIYQYILDVKPGYEDRYSVTDLRTIQDWMVKRQLSGISGVVEINTWGGFLKTYEVGVDPQRLQAMDITISEVYNALLLNNTVAGGGYIEKSNEAYFIRAEGLAESVEDLQSIVVTHKGNAPVYIKDVAHVGFGSATRFGAITGNGEGEKVLGQIMMLKGADSKKVIDAVIERVDAIQSTLPEGVFINPFLERSELIGKTTFTVAENLILGFLIVLFVVVFLLGNIRSGLVVASVIPLTLLFALSMMYLFGVDANLMSLGAIDFGIIIDGAVIIVEYIAFSITKNASQLKASSSIERKSLTDRIVSEGANKMMHSAVFGQIIIIIVFIPILALTGVEGKMFRPMALTFCFALLGAMILCFTYVPVVSSLFLKPTDVSRRSLSDQFINGIKKIYKPILKKALQLRVAVIALALILFAISTLLFTRMGGEFVPTLDEGDFVIQPVLKTGMSLAETVKMTTRIEKILKTFPEVKQVVSRIGAAEVPTDPMSMEESDVIITLEKKSEWTSAKSKDELADRFKEALLDQIPGVEIEFTQPIEMRFNELISGARSDLAIKLFGEDLDILYEQANNIESAIRNVDGAADISVEKIDGLPQMSVKYDRLKMAKYGVNIEKLNEVISMGFAGKSAGSIYEGESKFDIVLRYASEHRQDIEQLRNALIEISTGQQLPLSEFADIDYSFGPAKISRDNTKRRVVIGVNVRGRDLQSVVDEIQGLIENNISLPSGYFIEYGGQFENLEKATQRLLVAVPIALILIFILLYFAFGSVKEALLIFSAIPLATIGGVLALQMRGLPFSISAGIGFIALFGIAVLNGIVMIEHFKELKSQGEKKLNEFIVEGAVDRLRPVLLTAFAAALGFLPMAISTSAGAEVQRPLATVVIGGLVSATLLTLVVLPVLYSLFTNYKSGVMSRSAMGLITIMAIGLAPKIGLSQTDLSLEETIQLCLDNNIDLRKAEKILEREVLLIDASQEINPIDAYYGWDRNNTTEDGTALHVVGASHAFKMPSVNRTKKLLQEAEVKGRETAIELNKTKLKGYITAIYDKIKYTEYLLLQYEEINELYGTYISTTERKMALGEGTKIEKLTTEQKRQEWNDSQQELKWNLTQSYQALQNIVQSKEPIKTLPSDEYEMMSVVDDESHLRTLEHHQTSLIEIAEKSKEAQGTDILPEINLSLFYGINGISNLGFYPGFEVGLSLPINKKQNQAKQSAADVSIEIAQLNFQKLKEEYDRHRLQLLEKIRYLESRIETYDESILASSSALLKYAQTAMDGGALDHFQFLLILENKLHYTLKKVDLIHEYNQTIISLNYLINQ